LFFAALAALWEFGTRGLGVRRYLLPPLSDVARAGWSFREEILAGAWTTSLEVLAGFAAAVAGGIVLGVSIHSSRLARRTVYPLLTAFSSMPKIALAPLMIVWFGYGFASKIAAAFLFAFFPVVIATLGGLSSTPESLDEHFRALGAGPLDAFWRLRVPAALPSFVDGLRIAMPLAVIGAIVGEFVGAEKGLGHLMLFATANGRTDVMFAAIVAVTLLALGLYGLLELLSRLVWWRSVGV
jgi:NitT/TauT family transport system permease protein